MVIINDVFSPNCICTYQEKKSYLYLIHTGFSFVLCMVQVNTYLIYFNKNKANLTIFVGAIHEISHL